MSITAATQFLFDISEQDATLISVAIDPWAEAITYGNTFYGYKFTQRDLALALPAAEATENIRTSMAKLELMRQLRKHVS